MNANGFRLQSVLDLRASALEEAQNTLGRALASLGAARDAFRESLREAGDMADAICSHTDSQPAAQLKASRQSYLEQARHVRSLQENIQECHRSVQQCREQVVKASREHEILVRLREKRLKAGQFLENRKEENLLNDVINSQRLQTRRRSSEEFQPAQLP